MKLNVFTLCEGHYHFGVAALVNSLAAIRFSGNVSVHYRGDLPPWTTRMPRAGGQAFRVADLTLTFVPADPPRHFGYHKPFAALEELRRDPECDAVLYADPDIVFLAPVDFYRQWVRAGVALCLDFSFPFVGERHPWRVAWAELLRRSTGDEPGPGEHYANSGFFGVARRDAPFLEKWAAVTRTFEAEGGNTRGFSMGDRHQAIVGDQDLLAAALMGWKGDVSLLGAEGMGFTGYNLYLSHDLGHPKPWRRSFLREALRGRPPTISAGYYLRFANGPVSPFTPGRLAWKKAEYRVAQAISRVWRAPVFHGLNRQ